MKKLLMHVCCGPCFSYIEHDLRKNGLLNAEKLTYEKVDYTAFFYNFNIHKQDEYEKRKESFIKLCNLTNTKYYILDKYGLDEFIFGVRKNVGKDKRFDKRCKFCYYERLYQAFLYAKENNFDIVSTTLTISPYQDHEAIKSIGKLLEEKFNIEFRYVDYRPYYKKGQEMAKEYGLYMQKYCGCIFSLKEKNRLEELSIAAKKSELKLLKPSTMFKSQIDSYKSSLLNKENYYFECEKLDSINMSNLLVIRKSDNKLIGMVRLKRQEVDDKIVCIEYSILKDEIKKEYEGEILNLALIKCRQHNFNKILIKLRNDETLNKSVVSKNYGIIESEIVNENEKEYYINLK